MADIIIPDVPDDVIAAIDVRPRPTSCVLSANSGTRLNCSVAGRRPRIDRSPTFRFNV